MPITHRTNDPGAPPAARASWMNQVWPAVITLTAAIVFLIFLIQDGMAMALAMAVATLLAGGILLTLVSGTAWIGRLRDLPADLRGRR